MRSTHRPPRRLERTLVLVLAGFIAVDLLLVLPAFASEVRLDRLHPSLPIVNLRPLAAGRARIADGLGEEFTAPVRELAGELKQAGAKAFNAVLFEVNTTSEDGQGNSEAAFPLAPSATPTPIPDFEPKDKSAPTQTQVTGDSSPEPSHSPEATLDPDATVLPSPTVDSFETAVAQTATALALPKKTKLPPPTKTPGPSYTPTSTSAPTEQMPSMTPTQKIVATATVICAIGTPGCQTTPDPSSTPTAIPTVAPSPTPLPTQTQTAVPVPTHSGPVPAFPGAQGWGAESVGGRGGQIIQVTNLNDSGPGSLRAAVEGSGPRIVIFRVAGVINLDRPINIVNPYITIAGQSAPGSGIVLRGENLTIRTHDVIIRYISYRGTGNSGDSTFFIVRSFDERGAHDIIVDHCSGSWANDDLISINQNSGENPDIYNVTIQNCLFGYPSPYHPTTLLIANNSGFGRTHHVSVHNNLFSTSGNRNPNTGGVLHVEIINNVVYNFRHRVGNIDPHPSLSGASEVDLIGNYWQRGSTSDNRFMRFDDTLGQENRDYPTSSIFARGNFAPVAGGLFEDPVTDPDVDNWPYFTYDTDDTQLNAVHRRLSQLSQPTYPVLEVQATDARERILADSGNSRQLNDDGGWTFRRDSYDQQLVDEAINDTGPDVGDFESPGTLPNVDAGTPYTDSDSDGMADKWELLYCLDPNNASDGSWDTDGDGYTNVEEFLNGTQPTSGGSC